MLLTGLHAAMTDAKAIIIITMTALARASTDMGGAAKAQECLKITEMDWQKMQFPVFLRFWLRTFAVFHKPLSYGQEAKHQRKNGKKKKWTTSCERRSWEIAKLFWLPFIVQLKNAHVTLTNTCFCWPFIKQQSMSTAMMTKPSYHSDPCNKARKSLILLSKHSRLWGINTVTALVFTF